MPDLYCDLHLTHWHSCYNTTTSTTTNSNDESLTMTPTPWLANTNNHNHNDVSTHIHLHFHHFHHLISASLLWTFSDFPTLSIFILHMYDLFFLSIFTFGLESLVGLWTIPYYGYSHNFYRPKQVSISHTHTVQSFFKAWTVWHGHFYGRNTVYGMGKA